MYKYFTAHELKCRCGCERQGMKPEFMQKVERLREAMGTPFIVTSAYRCPAHNQRVSPGTGKDGPHTTGRAIDIHCFGKEAYRLQQRAMESHDFTGIGLQQRGDISKRFIHLDDINNDTRPWIWTYP